MTAEVPTGDAAQNGAEDLRSFTTGQRIFAEGQVSDFAFVIVSGRVEVLKSSPDGDMRLAVLGPGEMFGEMGLLDGTVRSATAIAGEDTVVSALSRDRLLAMLVERPETAIDLVKAASRRLRRANSLICAPKAALVRGRKPAPLTRLRRFLRPGDIDLDRVRIEFQPDAIEIEERPLPFGAKAILYTIVALIICSSVWASVATMDRIVVATGRIATTDAKLVVQPMQTATIRSIDVRPGQIVEKGQVLVSLDSTFAAADEQSVRAQMKSSGAEIRRLEAELALESGTTAAHAPPQFSDDADEQRAQLDLYQRYRDSRRTMIQASETEARELDTHMASLRADRVHVTTQMATLEKLESIRKELYSRGNGSLINLLDAQRQLDADKREMEHIANDIGETIKKKETIQAKLAASLSEMTAKAAQELQAARRDYAKAAEQTKKQERLSNLIDLRSPAKAMVLDLGNRSVGSVIKEGETMVTLVALDVPLDVDAVVDPKDISHLRPGDTARIKLEAFPYQKYGTLDGVIQSINGDVTEHEEAGRKANIYKVRVAITANNLHDVPADIALLPGMVATCEIKVGTRRLITYFLYPIVRTLDSGLREP
jgi:HlyD family secretion protein